MDALYFIRIIHDVEEANAVASQRENPVIFDRSIRDPFSVPDVYFEKTYRLPKALVRSLCDDLRPAMPAKTRKSALSVEERVLTALSFYGSGSYQNIVGAANHMCQMSVSRCIESVTNAINAILLPKWIRFPKTEEGRAEVKRGFLGKFNIPGVLGAIDGTHVAVVAPSEKEHLYMNRKGYFSLNVQLVCDSNLNILAVCARYPGVTHDNFIWTHCKLREFLESEHRNGRLENSWLLGDSGYALEPWLMVPLDHAESGAEQRYNRKHTLGRNTVERTFGILKSRFRCLLKHRTLHYSTAKAGKIFNACAVLHNICNHHKFNLPVDDDDDALMPMIEEIPVPVPTPRESRLHLEGRRNQKKLINIL